MKFREHGNFSIEIEGNTLILDAMGPFNAEVSKRYEQAMAEAVHSFGRQPWHQIVLMHGTSILTPEAEAITQRSMASRKALGLVASAVVLGNVEAKALIINQLSRCYNHAGIEHQFFKDLNSARRWLCTKSKERA